MAKTYGKVDIQSKAPKESKKSKKASSNANEGKLSFVEKRKRQKELKKRNIDFKNYPFLVDLKPKEKYVFHSDYFEVDNQVATIMSFFHMAGATDGFPPFWGVGRTPRGLRDENGQPDNEIVTIGFEQIRRMSRAWIDDHQSMAEGVAKTNSREQEDMGTSSTKTKANRKTQDLEEISRELGDNAAYLQCHYKLMVKAPNLEKLDAAVTQIASQYTQTFSTLSASAMMGMQRQELSNLFQKNQFKPSRPFYFTSPEFAGSYSLVTHGVEDPYGEYVGHMFGDINNAAVLFNVDGYDHHIVVGSESYFEGKNGGRINTTNYWASKISQSCLFHNRRVVHIILDDTNLDKLGPKFEDMTYTIDMNNGDVNMFEMFGDYKDELAVFATQMQKLILMAEQAYHTTDSDRSIIENHLEEIATRFYIGQKMWYSNARENRQKIRTVNIPHNEVPVLHTFVSYLNQEYVRIHGEGVIVDEELSHAVNVLKGTFTNLLSTNGDLFDKITSSEIDGVKGGRRVIYNFSKLRQRGEGVAMAQLVNIIGFAIGNLSKGDTIIIHGADRIANHNRLKEFLSNQLDTLYLKGGRAVFLYNNIDKMLKDKGFSHFDKADYTLFGRMSDTQVAEYQQLLGQSIPSDLSKLITYKDPSITFLRRGYTNVVFQQDLKLGIDDGRKGARL